MQDEAVFFAFMAVCLNKIY